MQRTVNAGVLFDLSAAPRRVRLRFRRVRRHRFRTRSELHDLARRTLAGNGLDRACRAYDRGRTEEVPVDDFVAFAFETWPRADELPEWAALERRRSRGPARAARDPRFVVASLVRRAFEEASKLRWRHTGEVGPQRWQHLGAR